jgi:molecular chaperone GrpE
MTDSTDKKANTEPAIEEGLSGDDAPDADGIEGGRPQRTGDGHGAALVEPAQEAVLRLEAELDSLKDRHLRVVAEYDNFRKRTSKERAETWGRAQADVVANLLDALDDLGRVADLDAQVTSAADVIKGVELVERKFLRELESAGLERAGEPGETFDPNVHEAVGSLPAESSEEDQTVGAVLQIGYRFGGVLIRPARVQVKMWQGGGAEG